MYYAENRIVKIAAYDNEITLFVDNKILKRGIMYEWTVSEIKYPNLNETIFYNFELLNENKFNELKSEINGITTDLQKLGFNPDEIKIMLCED